MKQTIIFSFSKKGVNKSREIAQCLNKEYTVALYAPAKYAEKEIVPLPDKIGIFTGKVFEKADVLIYVGACGIAIRAIAPYIKSKTTDPAVICVDECGNFCISLLSGHIGGGNRLARQIGKKIGAVSVITTATDVNGLFAVDQWAAEQGFVIGDMETAKQISAAILEGDISICSDKSLPKRLPAGLRISTDDKSSDSNTYGISVSIYIKNPFEVTLRIIPRVLTLGIGCRRGTTKENIMQAVQIVLKEYEIDIHAIESVASIDLKADETGLLDFCNEWQLPVKFYTSEQLLQVEGDFTSSAFVQNITGVDNVCERSAVISGGKLIIKKFVYNGVTIAVAEKDWEVRFE